MSRARVAVLKAVSGQLSVTAAAAEYGFSRRHLHRLLARYREGDLDALEPRSRAPRNESGQNLAGDRRAGDRAPDAAHGGRVDAGPVRIAWHFEQEGLPVPSTSTVRRILHQAGLIVPEPRKRPGSSYRRFEMAQPNEMWQSDFIHWRLADGTDVEVLPGPPQTQGKTERFHQTLQRWLAARATPRTIAELQQQLDQFREHYNEQRPHRALKRQTPGEAYRATPKAAPASDGHAPGHYRLRYDRLDPKGKMTIRRAGRMHHLHTCVKHARKRVLAFADDHKVTVAELATGEILSVHLIEPDKTYWRNQMRVPGRWPNSPT